MKLRTTLPVALVAGALLASLAMGQPAAAKKEKEKKSSQPTQPAPAGAGQPAGAALRVGSAAPKLSVDAWVKGAPVAGFEKGRVYVVEFWATWCGPCIQSIPHLTQLQARYKDTVTVIGVAASEERTAGSDQRLAKLEQFVRTRGEQMGYAVAFDGDRDMGKAWMEAAGQSGIPCAFVVGHDGKIASIGHPGLLDGALAKAVAAAEKAAKGDDAAKKTEKPATKPVKGAKPVEEAPAKQGG